MFLPENYEPPSSNGNYLKLQQGTNKIRILSQPLIGWEIWVDGHPKRALEKPESMGEIKPREFWAMVAWNYESEKIQLFHVTQGSIKKSIRDLACDETWGSPVEYDLKIVREGHQLKTSYSVTPCPKSAVKDHIKQAFKEHPCYLQALLTGDDPFTDGRSVTPLWELTQNASGSISKAQHQEIIDLIGDDKDYLVRVTKGVTERYNITDLDQLPLSAYDKVLTQVKLHAKERMEKEMANAIDNTLPF